MIETTLFAKTMIILCSQLSIVFGLTFYILKKSKEAYFNNTTFLGMSFRGAMNLKQEFDLIPYIEDSRGFPRGLYGQFSKCSQRMTFQSWLLTKKAR